MANRGLGLEDIGTWMSWWQFKCWLKWAPEDSAIARLKRMQDAENAIPEDERIVGRDAIPIDEMDEFLAGFG